MKESRRDTPHLLTCKGCLHYFITHEVKFPYGCAAFGIKSVRQPVRDVMEISWSQCRYFEAKPTGRPSQERVPN